MGQKQMGVCYRQVEMSVCSLLCWVDIHGMSIRTVNSKRDLTRYDEVGIFVGIGWCDDRSAYFNALFLPSPCVLPRRCFPCCAIEHHGTRLKKGSRDQLVVAVGVITESIEDSR